MRKIKYDKCTCTYFFVIFIKSVAHYSILRSLTCTTTDLLCATFETLFMFSNILSKNKMKTHY